MKSRTRTGLVAGCGITIFTLIGQAVYFRIAGAAVMRRMGWDNFGPAEFLAC